MKKRIYFLLTLPLFIISSCGEYCADCVELDSGYIADEFCGTSSQVDVYIDELESTSYQNWVCSKSAD